MRNMMRFVSPATRPAGSTLGDPCNPFDSDADAEECLRSLGEATPNPSGETGGGETAGGEGEGVSGTSGNILIPIVITTGAGLYGLLELIGGSTNEEAACTDAGGIWKGGQCNTPCPPSYQLVSGKCQLSACPPGTVSDGTNCVADGSGKQVACPKGTHLVMGKGGASDMTCKPDVKTASGGGGGGTTKPTGGSSGGSKNVPANIPAKKPSPTNWPLIAGIVGIVAVGGALAYRSMNKSKSGKKSSSKSKKGALPWPSTTISSRRSRLLATLATTFRGSSTLGLRSPRTLRRP